MGLRYASDTTDCDDLSNSHQAVLHGLSSELELGVQVVTGDRALNIFHDVDGIEFGQKWRKRLTEAISTSRFLIPVVTPLFLRVILVAMSWSSS